MQPGNVSVMGIINLSPDSFFDGGKWSNQNLIYEKIKKWEKAGIDYIDVGCESSRPGCQKIPQVEELSRLERILDIIDEFPQIHFSIDTYKPQVAKLALSNGFSIINDIYAGGRNGRMFEIAKSFNAKIIIMHMKGDPENMQINPNYDSVINEIYTFFSKKVELAISKGLIKEQVILDPGFGFGKRLEDNDRILCNLAEFKSLGIPLLIGCSRKSFLAVNNNKPANRLSTSIAAMSIGIMNGANIIRVHDVEDSINVKLFLNRYFTSNDNVMEFAHEC